MVKQVLMPQLGEAVVEGTLTKWLKQPGERVAEFEPLLEINTDKVDTEVPCPASGVLLEILIPEGTTVRAGTVLARIGEAEEAASQTSTPAVPAATHGATAHAAPATQPADWLKLTVAESIPPRAAEERDLGFLSPVVRRIATENQIDLRQVPGSGLGGRITKQDVLDYLEGKRLADSYQQLAVSQQSSAVEAERRDAGSAYPVVNLPGDEITPLGAVRRAVAEHMVFSERTAPHVTTVMEADLSRVVIHRQANLVGFERDGVRLTYTPYFIAAAVAALKAYPLVNSSWTEQGVVVHHVVNIGMATSLGEAGLIVPVIRNAEGLSLRGLAQAVNDLAYRARNRQLKPEEVRGGTFTITNHGISGSLFATPIINQPQCAILGVGAIQKRAVVITDANGGEALAIRPMAYLSLTFDHRILDGALADNFLAKVVKSLEEFTNQ